MSNTDEAATFWENLYREHRDNADLWGARPNQRLVEIAGHLPPGAALDLGCGPGGDTMWLARHGWRVTAVDIAATAVDRVRAVATEAGLSDLVTTERHDLGETFPAGTFDLISAQYFHTPFHLDRAGVLRTAAHVLRPDGLLLVVDHGSITPWSWNQDPNTRHPSPAEVYASLDLDPAGWTAERTDAPQREATGPGGQTATVTDHVLLVRRASHRHPAP